MTHQGEPGHRKLTGKGPKAGLDPFRLIPVGHGESAEDQTLDVSPPGILHQPHDPPRGLGGRQGKALEEQRPAARRWAPGCGPQAFQGAEVPAHQGQRPRPGSSEGGQPWQSLFGKGLTGLDRGRPEFKAGPLGFGVSARQGEELSVEDPAQAAVEQGIESKAVVAQRTPRPPRLPVRGTWREGRHESGEVLQALGTPGGVGHEPPGVTPEVGTAVGRFA